LPSDRRSDRLRHADHRPSNAKARPDAEGHVRRLCPASDGAYTARCDLKPRSIERTNTKLTRIPVTDALRQHRQRVCDQQSATFPPEVGAKLAQDLLYGIPKHAAVYASLRNAVEGMNGIAKDGGYAALADPTRRRIRGVAPQSLFVALLLMATNLRAIQSFLNHARPGADGVLRRPRKRRRTSPSLSYWTSKVAAWSGAPPP
jgi:hypothetical protein